MSHPHMIIRAVTAASALACFVGGCSTWTDGPTQAASGGLVDEVAPATTVGPSSPCVSEVSNVESTYAPLPSLAAFVPLGHALVVGVDDNTRMLSARNPDTNGLEGFEVDLAEEIGRSLKSDVQFKIVTTDMKTNAVALGDVDITISAVSITCKRWREVSFTAPYFTIHQRVMVRDDSDITSVADLNHRKVCVTTGSTSLAAITDLAPDVEPYEVRTRSQCLVALQKGAADAIFTHETFLWGFQQQDPHTRILSTAPDAQSNAQYYGIAVRKDNVNLLRAINTVLADPSVRRWLDERYSIHFRECAGCAALTDPAPAADLPMPVPDYSRPIPGARGG